MKTTLFGKFFLILPIVLMFTPFVFVFIFGLWYLYEKQWLIYWLLMVVGILAFVKITFLIFGDKHYEIFKDKPQVSPSDTWDNRDDEVFAQMQTFAKAIDKSSIAFNQTLPNRLLDMGIQITQKVASHYYPDSPNPALEVSLPHLLKISELVLKDMRKELIEKIPFSHRITINHFLKVPKVVDFFNDAHASYRVGGMIANPIGSILSEVKDHITSKLFSYSKEELLSWMVDFYILEVARYSIDLYGHNITLNEFQPTPNDTSATPSPPPSPLKIAVVGESNSGKSSLINALLGKPKAFVDALSTQTPTTSYSYAIDETTQALLIDTQGYGTTNNPKTLLEEIVESDIIVWVLLATNAARESDKALLEAITHYYHAHPKLRKPIIIGVLNHIDKISPQKEWNPPFDIQNPKTLKEQNIQQALKVAQKELEITPLIPINLHPNRIYNIEQTLVPTLLKNLQEATKVGYIRHLRAYQKREFWIKLKEQAKATHRLMIGKK